VISENRDPAFWLAVASHPAVAPHTHVTPDAIVPLIARPDIVPLATANGGFLFVQMDGLGRTFELHTLYRPEGWGREVAGGLKAAMDAMTARGLQLLVTHEVEGWWRSAPPRTHGWKAIGPFAPAGDLPAMKTWILTREAWEQSPARRRMR
jgi:hypothetical protein